MLLVLASVACLLSCRSVKNESTIATHHYSLDADTIETVSLTETRDSTGHYRRMVDSLSVELRRFKSLYRELYVNDSISTDQYRTDSEHVKDTTWMQVNADGSITYHHYREKNTYSYQQLERYRQQIVRESQATIDSLIGQNTYLQAQYDSIYRFKHIADSLSIYKAKFDSISNAVSEKEKTTVEKFGFWSRVKVVAGTIVACAIVVAIVFIYLRFFRR